ncbi:pyridoxamine 5'-phosphate oxidase family protein [Streptomyces sp. HD]|uniref:pyridoxamine 5'-phosphate oxidase family protein n=1 Tax=Streptomyces sp. HD TaxID=3020892 RepID=UPI00232EA1BA|nr:pyridoxamine 5'-phosphate oxidase family protein [Streptomyces sp. HD]MDC0773421.1 pyridoxamine 5'-phosphate oxidase family protein [Streptomyces sp. HD]
MTEGTETAEGARSAARAIIDGNMYMVLATVGPDGAPWAAPVFYSTEDGRDFYWVSSPEVTHSRNLAHEPRVGIVIHDSRAPVGTAGPRALYLAATATELDGEQALEGLRVIPGPAGRGGRALDADEVRPPAPWRVYRARVTAYSMICPRDEGRPCAEHGLDYEHRGDVRL